MSADPASEAFEHLRSEVALLRRAIEGLVAHQPEAAPDYAPTLASLTKLVASADEKLAGVVESPALALTPQDMASQITSILMRARADAKLEFDQAMVGVRQATAEVQGAAGDLRTREAHRRQLGYAALAGAGVALLLWLAFSGPVVRALPTGWQVPEKIAAATMARDRWSAGGHLMSGSDPRAWSQLLLGEALIRENHETLDACRRRAERRKTSVSCEVQVRP